MIPSRVLFLLSTIFLVGVLLNLLWEFGHSRLYETCRRQSWKQNAPLLISMALKDGLLLATFHLLVAFAFRVLDVTRVSSALAFFVLLCLGFAYVDERVSLRLKRWEYVPTMPRVFGVGATPLLELALTGVATLLIVFRLLPLVLGTSSALLPIY